MTAHIQVRKNRYGSRDGYYVFAFGFATILMKTIKDAKKWCESNGFEFLVIR